ncbi:MAG: hypothetical protein A2142_01380 [candidate division Zixibacteria bacterium RBG_16_48_11]|nr:MAG: hypothetical protein A2142_01380 [candidate division Zixibacteria bacterium RBG_16_48_11]
MGEGIAIIKQVSSDLKITATFSVLLNANMRRLVSLKNNLAFLPSPTGGTTKKIFVRTILSLFLQGRDYYPKPSRIYQSPIITVKENLLVKQTF